MNEPGIDLTGKLIIKVALGDDIRRILITNEDITYDELVLMMQRVYRGKLNSTDDIVIKYKDEDNDLITIFDSSDLSFAIQCSRILKITLFVNSKPEPLQTDEIKMIKTELKHIRDRCTKLLDRLDDREVQEIPSSSVDSTTNKGNITDSPRRQAAPSPRMPLQTNAAGGKEFDPLSRQRSMDDHQEKVMSSFGISNDVDRAGTPDSISSIGSAGQRQAGQITPQLPPQSTPQAPPQGTPQAPPQQPQQPKQPQQPATPSGMYGGPSAGQKMSPWQQQNQPQNATGQPSSYPGQQQQQGYPGSTPQGYPGQTPQPPASQPTSLPTSASGPTYGPGGAPYSSYSQPGQVMGGSMYGQQQPGQYQGQQPGQPGQPGPQGQTGHPSQLPGQQQQQQQPTPQSYYQPQQPGAPGQVPPPGPGSNPYARQGPGYSSGYPRPVASYPQGYQ